MLQTFCYTILMALTFCLGVSVQASVYAHPADGDISALRATAQTVGRERMHSVCGIFMSLVGGGLHGGSGFLVSRPSTGPARIVTAASNFYDQPEEKWIAFESMKVTFSGDMTNGPYTNVSRVYLRDSFEVGTTYHNDIAVLEVDTTLLPSTCVPLPLLPEDVEGLLGSLPMGTHAGYSPFATTRTPFEFERDSIKLYAGSTAVKYGLHIDSGYRTSHDYFTAEFVSPYSIKTLIALRSSEYSYHFDPATMARGQSLLSPLGRGGPLIFPVGGHPTVLGIFSKLEGLDRRYFWERWLGLDGVAGGLVCYEPIMPHVAWLQSPDLRVGSGKIFEFSVPV